MHDELSKNLSHGMEKPFLDGDCISWPSFWDYIPYAFTPRMQKGFTKEI